MKEIWKDIEGYEGLYQISNLGNIKSVLKKIYRQKMGDFIKKEFEMNPTKHKGYFSVILSKKNILKKHKIHRLVAEAFLNKKEFKCMPDEDRNAIDLNQLEVNHKDENKSNNCADNLEWCTHLYNMNYGTWKYRREKNFDRSYCYKKVKQYDLRGNFVAEWDNISMAQKQLNISHISDCCNGKRKKAGGYIWKYSGVLNK